MDRIHPATGAKATLERHIASLVRRHRMIDASIDREARYAWSPRLKRLKRLRLALRDRIAALSRQRRLA